MRASSARVETCGGMARDAGSEATLGSGGSATTFGNTLAGMSLPSARAAAEAGAGAADTAGSETTVMGISGGAISDTALTCGGAAGVCDGSACAWAACA